MSSSRNVNFSQKMALNMVIHSPKFFFDVKIIEAARSKNMHFSLKIFVLRGQRLLHNGRGKIRVVSLAKIIALTFVVVQRHSLDQMKAKTQSYILISVEAL